MSDKYASIHYHHYLQLDKILNSQDERSAEFGKAAHEETLFIIIHQVYELWFKQILHEVNSIMEMFHSETVDERNIGTAVSRVERVNEILKLLVQQIKVLETMTPLDFLDFRNYLFPASGFQSFQFRKLEVMLGLKIPQRHSYTSHAYYAEFEQQQQDIILQLEKSDSLLELINKWLERTPFLEFEGFTFIDAYKTAVLKMLDNEKSIIQSSEYLSEQEKAGRLKMLGETGNYYTTVLDMEAHKNNFESGELKLSYKATIAALLINLYRDEPILQLPFRLLSAITEMDELITSWRYRHAQMVMRMLGRKTGTGGSSGFDYLMQTVLKHQIFRDLHHISTLLIPRSDLPKLPEHLIKELGFYFSNK